MKIILKKDVENLGFQYDELDVKPGYARNYLIPKGFAVPASPGYIKNIQEIFKQRAKKEGFLIEQSKNIEEKLKEVVLTIPVKVGKEGKLFGSINNQHIVKILKEEKGISIEKKFIRIPGNKSIKTIGKYYANIRLHKTCEFVLKFQIIERS
ncbi:50S ribosomal protein L9 [Blattabacterium cuenoti]